MAFYIDTSKVGDVSDNIDQISDKCGDVISSVESYDTNNEGGFDFSGAKAAIENNLEGIETKFKNTVALLTAVINAHGGIQKSVSGTTGTSGTSSASCSSPGCSSRGYSSACSSPGCSSRGCSSPGCGSSGGTPTPATQPTSSPYEHGEFVNYYQYNFHQSYGYGTTIASAGCGPTSMAMVLTYLLGETHDPVEIANWSLERGYHIKDNGTAWSFFPACAKAYGVECTQLSVTRENIINYLKAGKTIIMNVGPGHFTSGGHYIVLRGLTEDGKVIVADPASEKRSSQVWDIDVFLKEGKGMWAFDGGKPKKEETTVPVTDPATVPETVPETAPPTEPKTEPETVPETSPAPEPEKQSLLDYLREMNAKYEEEHGDDTGANMIENNEDTTLDSSDIEGMIN